MTVERVAEVGTRVGESPLWLPERGIWLWLDLQGRTVFAYDRRTNENRTLAENLPEDLACLARWTPDAALLVSVTGFHRLDLTDGTVSPLPCPVPLPGGTIFNDGKVDRHGALWIGSSDRAESEPLGRLWRVSGGTATEVARGFVVSNGPAFSADAAYFADTFARRLLRFALDPEGRVTGQSTFATIPEEAGYPDGMTVDAAGVLHVGHWDGARITCWSPDGRALSEVPVPARNVTSLAFGGDALRDALITTAILFPGQEPEPDRPWNGDLLILRDAGPGLEESNLAPDWLG
jgi:sugar lactone lactonase YvrE